MARESEMRDGFNKCFVDNGDGTFSLRTDATIQVGAVEIGSIDGTGTQDSPVDDKGLQAVLEAKSYDGSALPNAVGEGDAVRQAGTPSGVAYAFLSNPDGSDSPMVNEDAATQSGQETLLTSGTVADVDGSAFPTLADTEGDAVTAARSQQGVTYVHAVDDDGVPPYGYTTVAEEATATDGTFNYYINMTDRKYFSVQLENVSGGSGTATFKVYASNDGDSTPPSAALYTDVTMQWFGQASFVNESAWLEKDTPTPCRYIKMEMIASTGGANDAAWDIYTYVTK